MVDLLLKYGAQTELINAVHADGLTYLNTFLLGGHILLAQIVFDMGGRLANSTCEARRLMGLVLKRAVT